MLLMSANDPSTHCCSPNYQIPLLSLICELVQKHKGNRSGIIFLKCVLVLLAILKSLIDWGLEAVLTQTGKVHAG